MDYNGLTTDNARSIAQAWFSMIQSMQQLSSGLRVRSASDDAAGLAMREGMRAEIAAAQQEQRNLNDAVSMVQTADGALSVVNENLIRMKQLTTQAGDVTLSADQKQILQDEFNQLAQENTRIAETTSYNDIKLFKDGQRINISLGDKGQLSINTQTITDVSGDLVNDPQAAARAVNDAIARTGAVRSELGGVVHRLETAGNVLDNQIESMQASESRISDTDMAAEVALLISKKVLSQTSIAVMAQVNRIQQGSTLNLFGNSA